MKRWKRILAVAVVAAAAGVLLYFGLGSSWIHNLEQIPENALVNKPTLNLWYTDEALSDYLSSVALDFSEENDVRVIPRLVSGLEYLESINEESLTTNSIPDLYIVGNDSLEKAVLAGLAVPIRDEDGYVGTENFPETAIHAVTYHGNIVGYPFYYETSALVYNKTYMEQLAESVLEAEADARAGEEAMQALDENGEPVEDAGTDDAGADGAGTGAADETESFGENEIQRKAGELIPENLESILTFADSYDAPEQVEAVFKWDVSDIFYNYFFVGNYLNVGGADGDNTDEIDLYNLDAIRCLQSYQALNQFFSIEPDEVDYDSVVQEFLEGKLVFTVATTDVVARLETAKENGEFPYEYGVINVPDINDELATRSLSVTSAVVVNGYSEKKDIANEFARYLTGTAAGELYGRTGKMSARRGVSYELPQAEAFFTEYEKSVSIPKMMATSNYWVQMEIAFTQIWSGEDVSETLKGLSEQIMTQVTGEPFEEEYIAPPVEETETGTEEGTEPGTEMEPGTETEPEAETESGEETD